jgi:predicted lipase
VDKDATVLVSGHSLGGALASLCTLDLKMGKHSSSHVKLITFGQPRVGNTQFEKAMQSFDHLQIWRIVHWLDPVPHLPLRSQGATIVIASLQAFILADAHLSFPPSILHPRTKGFNHFPTEVLYVSPIEPI